MKAGHVQEGGFARFMFPSPKTLVLRNLRWQFLFLMCNIFNANSQLCCWTRLDISPPWLRLVLAVRARPLFYASSVLESSTYCSKILIFQARVRSDPAPSWRYSVYCDIRGSTRWSLDASLSAPQLGGIAINQHTSPGTLQATSAQSPAVASQRSSDPTKVCWARHYIPEKAWLSPTSTSR
jgi:hypothetical protein